MKTIIKILSLLVLLSTLSAQSSADNLITIHAEDTDLSIILSIIAEDTDYNIVTGPSVAEDQKLTIHLDNMPVLEALDLIVRAAGLSYEVKGKSILIAEASKLDEETGLLSYVIELEHADANEVKDLLKNITDKVTIDKNSNKLLIKASPKKFAEIQEIIKNIDIPSLQSSNEKNLVTIHAEDTDLSSILSKIAEDSDYNIVTGPSVSKDKKLTIHIDNTPILEALDLIIRAAGLSYEVKGKSILIAEASKLDEETGLFPYIIELKYADANEVKDLLKNITDKVTIDKNSNKLLIKASPKKFAEIQEIIQNIDIPALQSFNEKNLVTIHAEDSDLSSILSKIAEDSDYNIVTGPSISKDKKLTVHLDNTPILEALDLIIRASGLSYELKGKSILIAEPSKLDEETGLFSYVIELKYVNAADAQELLKNITDNITVDKSGNKLLIKASPKKFAEIKGVINSIDVPAIQIMLEARLIEISTADEEKLGIDWSRLAKLTTIIAENASPLDVAGGGQSGSLLPGMSYIVDDLGNIIETFEPQNTGEIPGQMYFQRINPNNTIGFSRQMTAFDVTLDMLIKNNEATVLADSKVVTLNGHSASISMVDVVPYILSSGGVGGQVQVAKEEVGIKLDILPTVNTDGFITTEITPEVSSIYDFIGPDQNIPWVKKRVSNTTIRVQNEESIVIAGLLSSDKRYETHKVPFLWRLPYIGKKFFITTSESERKTDLIIQITPRIVNDNYSGIEKSSDHRKNEMEAAPEGKNYYSEQELLEIMKRSLDKETPEEETTPIDETVPEEEIK